MLFSVVFWSIFVPQFKFFYRIDDEEKKVYIFDILTVEQAHKNMKNFYINYRNSHKSSFILKFSGIILMFNLLFSWINVWMWITWLYIVYVSKPMDQGNLKSCFFTERKKMENTHFYRTFSTLLNSFWNQFNKLIKWIAINLSLKL